MAFSKLKALIRKGAARSFDDLLKAPGRICELFSEEECESVFIAAGCETE